MHPELFLLLYQQRERQLEQLHARRAAAAERFELTGASAVRPAPRAHAVPTALSALSALAARLRTAASPTAVAPTCCPAV